MDDALPGKQALACILTGLRLLKTPSHYAANSVDLTCNGEFDLPSLASIDALCWRLLENFERLPD